jgi:hypothetical protein
MHRPVVAAMLLIGLVSGALADARARRGAPLTVEAAVETGRFITDVKAANDANPDGVVSLSPDGSRWVARVVRGDIQRDGVWLEITSGSTGSLEEASRARIIARLFTSGLGRGLRSDVGPHRDVLPNDPSLRWIDNERIAFLWSSEQLEQQVVSLDITSGELRWLTQHSSSITHFDIADDTIVFNAMAPMRTPTRDAGGTVLGEGTDVFGMLIGGVGGPSILDLRLNTLWYVQTAGGEATEVFTGEGYPDADSRHSIRLSPNGRRALIDATAHQIPTEWDLYEAPDLRSAVSAARINPNAPLRRALHRLKLLDVETRAVRDLWPVPMTPFATEMAWSPDGRLVVVAPTTLPINEKSARELSGEAAVVIDVESGAYEVLPITLTADRRPDVLRFVGLREIEISQRGAGNTRYARLQQNGLKWGVVPDGVKTTQPAITFRVDQDLSRPPRLLGQSREGSSRVLLDPNSGFVDRFELGVVRRVSGDLRDGRHWIGLLMYPTRYDPRRCYPLVIQSVYGTLPSEEFTLYGVQRGYGMGPTVMAAYPGRALAAHGMFVLHLNVSDVPMQTPQEAMVRQEAFESAVDQLQRQGLIDPTRVGVAGFSRNGYYVEYTLTHSNFKFAAAVAADNWDPSYVQQTIVGFQSGARTIGAMPFAEGLSAWLAHSPGFNAHRVSAPLLMIEQAHGGIGGVLAKWELYSRLRSLRKPVEFFIMPNIEYGAHNTQNPRQIVSVQRRVLEWFDFWLNGAEDPAPAKREQYDQWRRLRDLKLAQDAAPHNSVYVGTASMAHPSTGP